MNKDKLKMKTVISEMKNLLEGVKSRLDEAEDQINNVEDRVEKNTQSENEKKKDTKRMRIV